MFDISILSCNIKADLWIYKNVQKDERLAYTLSPDHKACYYFFQHWYRNPGIYIDKSECDWSEERLVSRSYHLTTLGQCA